MDHTFVVASKKSSLDFPGGTVVKTLPANAGDTVRALVREDPTCHTATKPVCHSYWVCALEACKPQLLSPRATTTEARAPGASAPQQEKPPQGEAHEPQLRVAPAHCN